MNKILFISNYKNLSGYSKAAQEFILAMDSIDIDVVPRHIELVGNVAEIPERILELEQKDIKGCNINIQFTLPHYFIHNGNFDKNIGYFFWETSSIKDVRNWVENINLMDELWVPCELMKDVCINSGVNTSIHIIPVPCNPSKYYNYYPKLEIPELQNQFTFYFIGEITPRKNLEQTLQAFHLEFEPYENVQFLIKGNKTGFSSAQYTEFIREIANKVKNDLKLYPIENYKNEIIISDILTEQQICQLHTTCDCLVAPSKGESWNLECFDAMGFGKMPISTNVGAPSDYLNTSEGPAGFLLSPLTEPVRGMESDLYTARQSWWNVDISQLRRFMRMAYENDNKEMKLRGIDRVEDYSYKKIGNLIKNEVLFPNGV